MKKNWKSEEVRGEEWEKSRGLEVRSIVSRFYTRKTNPKREEK